MRERPSHAAGEFIERDGAEKRRLNFISHFLPTFEAFLLVKLVSSEDRGLAVKSEVEDSLSSEEKVASLITQFCSDFGSPVRVGSISIHGSSDNISTHLVIGSTSIHSSSDDISTHLVHII